MHTLEPQLYNEEVIGFRGAYMVLNTRADVWWPSGGIAVGVHRVATSHHRDCTFLRAVRGTDALWRVVDLRQALPNFEREWRYAPEGDRPFLVYFSIRTVFESADAFTRWVEAADPTLPRVDGERPYTEQRAA